MLKVFLILALTGICLALPTPEMSTADRQESRKVLSSSVVTSVSVIMDGVNNSKTYFSDAVGKPVAKPATPTQLASPINLLNPDRYEFYTFDDSGDLVKRLMTLDEIQGIIASGDGEPVNYYSQSLNGDVPEERVDEVINNVQNVLKEEIQAHSTISNKPAINGPDVSSTWNLLLPAIFGSSQTGTSDNVSNLLSPNTVSVDKGTTISPDTEQHSFVPNTTSYPSIDRVSTTQYPDMKNATVLTTATFETSTHMQNFETTTVSPRTTEEKTVTSQSTAKPTINSKDVVDETTVLQDASTNSLTFVNEFKEDVQKTTTYTEFIPPLNIALSTQNDAIEKTSAYADTTVSETTVTPVTDLSTLKSSSEEIYVTESSTKNFPTEPVAPTFSKEESTTHLSTTVPITEDNETTTTTESLFTENDLKITTSLQEKTNAEIENPTLTLTDINNLLDISEENKRVEEVAVDYWQNLPLSLDGKTTADTTTDTTTPSQTDTSTTIEHIKYSYTTKKNIPITTVFVTERVNSTAITVETTTDGKQPYEIDKNMNDAVDTVISQMINQDVRQTTIDSSALTTITPTEAEFSTATSFTDVSEKNRYEEIDLDISETPTTIGYEGKSIQPIFEKLTTNNDLLRTTEVIETTESERSTLNYSTVPIKHLKTDSSESVYNFNHTTEVVSTTPQGEITTRPEVYYTTDISLGTDATEALSTTGVTTIKPTQIEFSTEEDNLSTTAITVSATEVSSSDVNVNIEPTTQTFITIETVTSSPKNEKQPERHVINRVSSTTQKQDTTWALVSTVSPHKTIVTTESNKNSAVDLVPKPLQGFGLEDSTSSLEADVFQFTELCNELAFSFWNSVTSGISFARSVVVSPFATTSVLAMVFLGARGATSGEMNDILKLDDMVTFNPHAVFKNVIESIEVSKKSGVAASVFVKELYSDKSKGKLLQFYKERVKQFYDGYVEEVNFKEINDVIRRRTNLLVKRQTWGKFPEFLKDNSLFVRPPLAAVAANIFQTDCSEASTAGRDGELHFVVLPSIRQRKLIPIPAVVYRSGFLAGYEPGLDATAVAIGSKDHTVSTILVIPGQQGISAPSDGLVRLETRLIESAFKQNSWSRLLRSLIPRPGLEVQIPRFSHKSVINATAALQRMGLKDVFNSRTADLKGLNGIAHELYLSDIVQVNSFATCGEGRIDETHHSEIYPATTNRSFRRIRKIQNYHQSNGDLSDEPRDYQRAFHDPLFDPTYLSLPLQFRPRQARLPDPPRLRFDRPFLYFVRHNPTGLILHMGRFNPRLLP
ncbi:hypothetical protein FQR65_LT12924 [Abscondita terminalis]|nr:hypothetical protein FQR65_LT12924 [Abscondita terminalis]